MKQAQDVIAVSTSGKELVEITAEIAGWLAKQRIATGLLTIFCRHTSASLLIQENADRDVHGVEGPDDMPSHIRTALTQVQVTIPISGGRMALGTWQGIYLFEHRRAAHRREVVLHLIGE